jgi:membrane protein DedA with SNARE-associated domain
MLDLIGRYGYLVVFFGVMLESAGIPLPGETILISAGALAHRGVLDFGDALFFGALGAVVGDQLGYWIGRFGGRPFVLRWGGYVLVNPERLGRAEKFFARHGGRAVFLARFVSGLRVFGALVAGTSRMPWGRFALYNALGGTLWATAAVTLGYFLWASISLVEHWAGRVSLSLIAVLALALFLRWLYRKVTLSGSGARPNSGDGSN